MKTKVKIFDTNFSHSIYSSDFQTSDHIEWIRNFTYENSDLYFLTDNYLFTDISGDNLIGWIIEPRGINPTQYEKIKTKNEKFKKVLTYDRELIELGGKFEFCPHCGCWIKPEDQKVYEKTKLVSYISSTKNFGTQGHGLRAQVREILGNKVDSFGRGHNDIPYKLSGLKDYMFSIVIENSKFDYYFSEKVMDCFATGTIPIYWGCPSIGDFFDSDGILSFNTIEELEDIISKISSEMYISKIKSVKANYKKSKDFILAEEWIYKNTKIFKK
jgi:hypothetical protein